MNPEKKGHHQPLLRWHTPEFAPLQRGKMWYAAMSLIMLALLAYSLMSRAFTMTAGLVLVVAVYALAHHKKPRVVEAIISKLGVEYSGRQFPYHELQAFWIVYKPPYVRSLYLKTAGKHPAILHIELNGQDPAEVRTQLLKELPELEGAGQPAIDILSRLLRLS